jgi:hypothetical protein
MNILSVLNVIIRLVIFKIVNNLIILLISQIIIKIITI